MENQIECDCITCAYERHECTAWIGQGCCVICGWYDPAERCIRLRDLKDEDDQRDNEDAIEHFLSLVYKCHVCGEARSTPDECDECKELVFFMDSDDHSWAGCNYVDCDSDYDRDCGYGRNDDSDDDNDAYSYTSRWFQYKCQVCGEARNTPDECDECKDLIDSAQLGGYDHQKPGQGTKRRLF